MGLCWPILKLMIFMASIARVRRPWGPIRCKQAAVSGEFPWPPNAKVGQLQVFLSVCVIMHRPILWLPSVAILARALGWPLAAISGLHWPPTKIFLEHTFGEKSIHLVHSFQWMIGPVSCDLPPFLSMWWALYSVYWIWETQSCDQNFLVITKKTEIYNVPWLLVSTQKKKQQ